MHKFLLVTLLFFGTNCYSQHTDMRILKQLNIHRNKKLDNAFTFITNSSNFVNYGTIGTTLIIGFIKKENSLKLKAGILGASQLIAGVLTQSGKLLLKRDRPFITNTQIEPYKREDSYSMPSGHTSAAFANATALSLLYPKWYVIAPVYTYASLVAYSRIHLGVHYPSDVLVGAIVGSGGALLSHYLIKKIVKKSRKVRIVYF